MFRQLLTRPLGRAVGVHAWAAVPRQLLRPAEIASTRQTTRHYANPACRHGSTTTPKIDRNTAIRQLGCILQDGLLERGPLDTERMRRLGRKPNREIMLATATPWVDFCKHVPSGEHGVDFARETMKCFHDWLITLSPLDAQAEIEKAALGRRVFDWMLTLEESTRSSCGWDKELLNFLAHYLIAENDEGFFWRWLRREMAKTTYCWDKAMRAEYEDRYGWVGRLLGSIVSVHLARRLDKGNIDAALRTLISHEATRLRCPALKYVHNGAMITHIQREGRAPSCFHSTTAELYDRFVEIGFRDRMHTSKSFEWDKASILFRHPKGPYPDPLLKYLRLIEPNQQSRGFHPKTIREAWATWKICTELAEVLRTQGREDDAAWVDKLAEKFYQLVLAVQGGRRSKSRPQPKTTGRVVQDIVDTTPSDLLYFRKRR